MGSESLPQARQMGEFICKVPQAALSILMIERLASFLDIQLLQKPEQVQSWHARGQLNSATNTMTHSGEYFKVV